MAVHEQGYGLFCGVGIEGCDDKTAKFPADVVKNCNAGIADNRDGAFKRGPSVFNVLTVLTDTDGNQKWSVVCPASPVVLCEKSRRHTRV